MFSIKTQGYTHTSEQAKGQGMKEIVDVLATANGSRAEQLAARCLRVTAGFRCGSYGRSY